MSLFESVSAGRILSKERQDEILLSLRSELKMIHAMLEKQQVWFSSLRNELGMNRYSRITPIPFPRVIYDNHLPAIYSCLKQEDLSLLHLAYSYLAIIDSSLARFGEIIEESKKTYVATQPYAGAQIRVDDLRQIGMKALDIICHHLTEAPLQYPHAVTHLP